MLKFHILKRYLKTRCQYIQDKVLIFNLILMQYKKGNKKPSVHNGFELWTLDVVRVTGLEPVRHGHTPLKRACLPVPAHPHFWLLE